MKVNLFSIILIISTSSAFADNCSEWPKTLTPVSECCDLPYYLDYNIYYECVNSCLNSTNINCHVDCYVNGTNITSSEGVLNKEAILKVYMNNAFNKGWKRIISKSIDKCSIVTKFTHHNLETELVNFFLCVRNESLPECLEFYGYEDCYESEKHFLHCNNISFNCEKWPERFTNETLQICCKYPEIFTEEYYNYCDMKCTFARDTLKCTEKCLYFDSGIVTNGEINAAFVREKMLANSVKSEWHDIIDESIGTCLGEYYIEIAKNETHVYHYNKFEECISTQMSASCVDFYNDYECKMISKYKEQCPDMKPNGINQKSMNDIVDDLVDNN